jgi:branched-chain amino acid transport system ATP-binding protein
MLALARMLLRDPKLVIVDELSLGLAPMIRERLLALLREVADQGAAVLVVEQSVASILAVADRAVVLRRGEVVLEDDARMLGADIDRVARSMLD